MRDSALVIYLDASLGELWHRLRHDKVRPLLLFLLMMRSRAELNR